MTPRDSLLSPLPLEVPATLPLSFTRHEGSAHGDMLAPLLPTPAAEAGEEMTTPGPLPAVPTPALNFHSEHEQTGHSCKPTPATQPGKQLEEDSI